MDRTINIDVGSFSRAQPSIQHRSCGDLLVCYSLAANWAKVSCLQTGFPNGFCIPSAMVFKLSLLLFPFFFLSSVTFHTHIFLSLVQGGGEEKGIIANRDYDTH